MGQRLKIASVLAVACALAAIVWVRMSAAEGKPSASRVSDQTAQATRVEREDTVQPEAAPATGAQDENIVAGEVLVSVASGLTADGLKAALVDAGCKTVDPDSVEEVSSGVMRLSVVSGNTVQDAIDEISWVEGVRAAQPNYVYRVN